MERCWLHNLGCQKLIIFCNGWGMDDRPFRFLASEEYDVLCLYDYRQLGTFPELDLLAEKYLQIFLVSWSMGVWAGQKLFHKRSQLFQQAIAINGTLCPRDNTFGIPHDIFDGTLSGLNEKNRNKFYLRMCRQKTIFQSFLACQPERSVVEQTEELKILKDLADCQPESASIYNTIIISDNDLIMPTANQQKYWQTSPVIQIPGFHYIFSSWKSWDELLGFARESSVG